MKKLFIFLLLLSCFISFSFGQNITSVGPMVPLSYSNSCIYCEYFVSENYIHASDTNSKIIGYNIITTNMIRAKLHVVTFGIGTNAHFKLWTCEVFDPPPAPWKPSDSAIFIEPSTWISEP